MAADPVKTRFAPSPTGFLHLGNARTALFSALAARRDGGVFLLRIEDTDRDRSREEFVHAVQEDLWWLGLQWQEGPTVDGPNGPYRQSQREDLYAEYYKRLQERGRAYPCFCTPEELALSRKARRSAGQAPRYSGKCANLSETEVEAKLAAGGKPTLRFRVPADGETVFDDLVRGKQRFRNADIGDFVIRRADGSPAFFFCNAVDDALMGVDTIYRGEDHITNTPRQLLILDALALPLPRYGHTSMIVGPDASPLSKRQGARSIRELREEGYFPAAVTNYLARLGHVIDDERLLPVAALAAAFDPARLGRAPARYDAHQMLHWQRRAVETAEPGVLWQWMGEAVHHLVPAEASAAFVDAIRPNISFPEHARKWAQIVYSDPLNLDDHAREVVAGAGLRFFRAAIESLAQHGEDFDVFAAAVRERTGCKGNALFMPLRAALTGESGGPEMGRILPLLGVERARLRLEACLG